MLYNKPLLDIYIHLEYTKRLRGSWIKFKFNNANTDILYITYSQTAKLNDFQLEN